MKRGQLVKLLDMEGINGKPLTGIIININERTVPAILTVKVSEEGQWSEVYTTCDDVEEVGANATQS